MSQLGRLDDGFGDDNTFTLALLGLRGLIDDVVEVATQPAAMMPSDDPEPSPATADEQRFGLLLLGMLQVKELLDELCDEPHHPLSAMPTTPDRPTSLSSSAEHIRDLLR